MERRKSAAWKFPSFYNAGSFIRCIIKCLARSILGGKGNAAEAEAEGREFCRAVFLCGTAKRCGIPPAQMGRNRGKTAENRGIVQI